MKDTNSENSQEKGKKKRHKCHCGRILSQEMIDYQLIQKCACGREFKLIKPIHQPESWEVKNGKIF